MEELDIRFQDFLGEELYEKFLNYHKAAMRTFYVFTKPERWITLAFEFKNTEEGYEFWAKKHYEWEREVRSKNEDMKIEIKSTDSSSRVAKALDVAIERMEKTKPSKEKIRPHHLKEFLGAEVFEKFLVNLKKSTPNASEFFENKEPASWIYDAFVWTTSEEGESFWVKKSIEWVKHVGKLEEKSEEPNFLGSDLKEFLGEEVWSYFLVRLAKQHSELSPAQYFEAYPKESWISCAFSWDDKHDWGAISTKWRNLVNIQTEFLEEKITPESFKDFLGSIRWEKFVINLKKHREKDPEEFFEQWKSYPGEWINKSSKWSATPEGQEFWEDIHDEWRKMVRDYEEKHKK